MTWKPSAPSLNESLFTATAMVLLISPGAKVSVPDAAV